MKSRWLRISWIIFWIVFPFVGAELGSRWLLDVPGEVTARPMQPYLINGDYYGTNVESMLTREGPEVYGYERKGGIYIFPFHSKVLNIEERGNFLFQDRVTLANNMDSDRLRVFIIGGSTAYGTGASNMSNTWWYLLEQSLIESSDKEIKMIPAAMGGFNSTQERLVLELMVIPRKPDLIIILDGYNDLALPAWYGVRPGDVYNLGALYENFYNTPTTFKKVLAHSHLLRNLFFNSLDKALEENRQKVLDDPILLSNYVESTTSLYISNINRMVSLCEFANVPCLVFLQPARVITKGVDEKPSSIDRLTLHSYNKLIQRIQKEDLPIHNLTNIFDPSLKWMDSAHFMNEGHILMSQAIRPVLLQALE